MNEIAKHYVMTFLILDLVLVLGQLWKVFLGIWLTQSTNHLLQALRLLRMLRVVHVLRILNALTVALSTEEQVDVPNIILLHVYSLGCPFVVVHLGCHRSMGGK